MAILNKLTGRMFDLPIKTSYILRPLKNLSAMWENCVQSLGREDTLKKEIATHSSILAWRIPWTEECGGLQPWNCRVGHDEGLTLSLFHLIET